jgi:predicted nucleotidyltransferase
MKPSAALALKRTAVREAMERFRTTNPRVFGSVVHGTGDGSDLDLLVDALPGATLFDLGGLQAELEELLGVSVDLVTPGDLPPKFRQRRTGGGATRMSDNRLPEYLGQMRQAETNSCNSVTRIIKA